MIYNDFINRLDQVKKSGDGHIARCPSHKDKTPSLSIRSGEKGILIHCHAGCDSANVVAAMGLTLEDLFHEQQELKKPPGQGGGKRGIEKEYNYVDLSGKLIHQTIRLKDKGFRQRRPDPAKAGNWIWSLKDITPIIYNLPAVAEAIKTKKPIFITEGEKDADTLTALGYVATTSPMGAGKWRDCYSDSLITADVYIIPDNDTPGKSHAKQVAQSLQGKAATVNIIDLATIYPELPEKGDVSDLFTALGKTEGLRRFQQAIDASEKLTSTELASTKLTSAELTPPPSVAITSLDELYKDTDYFMRDGRFWRYNAKGEERQISNFVPIPTLEVYRDNGLESSRTFHIKAVAYNGDELPEAIVPADKFASMSWIASEWGYDANYMPGSGVKEYLRHAIMEVGCKYAEKKTVYTHTGWRHINGQWVFLHADGAIGTENIFVELEGNLTSYSLPLEATTPAASLETSLEFLKVAPKNITMPLLAFAYLSPLNEFLLQADINPAFIVFLLGATGTKKSTLAASVLCHFGKFTGKNLPGSFKSTANALEKQGFILKDVLTVIDDYHPSLQKSQSARMETTAQEITRSYGDRVGRGRMNSDTSIRETYMPRGNLIITGEDIPDIGQSGLARHLILEVEADSVETDVLTPLQNEGEAEFAKAMHGYIQWVAAQASTLPEMLKAKFLHYRNMTQHFQHHGRITETVAWLQIGMDMLCAYAASLGLSYDHLKAECLNILVELADRQNNRINNTNPAPMFIKALDELLKSGVCNVKKADDVLTIDAPKEKGFIGYEDEAFIYLIPGTAFGEVCQYYTRQGVTFPVTLQTLLKQLDTVGAIDTEITAKRRNRTKLKKIAGKNARFVWLRKTTILNMQ